MFVSPPTSILELETRAKSLAGLSLGVLAEKLKLKVPKDLHHHKGWVGELIETALGADAKSAPRPDFSALGIELKTIPINTNGLPLESTFIASINLMDTTGLTWENSVVRQKLTKVLWVPIDGSKSKPIAHRKIATPLLWSLPYELEIILKQDFEELMDGLLLEDISKMSAKYGEFLQIRPKAANARARTLVVTSEPDVVATIPRGFYLRSKFTKIILENYYTTNFHK